MATLHDHSITTAYGTFASRPYAARGVVGLALWLGKIDGPAVLPCRVHSSCFTSEGLGALDCDCVTQLDAALRAIAEAGRGVVFYLLQEGRGAGLRAKFRDREIVQNSGAIDTFGAYAQLGLASDPRSYAIVPEMCADLGVSAALGLMTNNPAKIAALEGAGLEVQRIAQRLPASDYNAAYLAAKVRHGHAMLPVDDARGVRVPSGLEGLDPRRETLGRFTRVASYSVPVRLDRARPAWFRATAYSDPESGHDRVVLGYRASGAHRGALKHVYRESLYERFHAGEQWGRYAAALERVVAHGSGTVLAIPADSALLSEHPGPSEADDHALLGAHTAALGAPTSKGVS